MITAAIFLADRTPGTAAALHGLPLDDGWIPLVYARALSRFEWFACNPGGRYDPRRRRTTPTPIATTDASTHAQAKTSP